MNVLLDAAVQGVPIRLELGPKDLEKETVLLVRRDTGAKEPVPWAEVVQRVPQLLEQIQVQLPSQPSLHLLHRRAALQEAAEEAYDSTAEAKPLCIVFMFDNFAVRVS